MKTAIKSPGAVTPGTFYIMSTYSVNNHASEILLYELKSLSGICLSGIFHPLASPPADPFQPLCHIFNLLLCIVKRQ